MTFITKKTFIGFKFCIKNTGGKGSHLKRLIDSFSSNPVQDTEIEKLIIKLNLEKALVLATCKLRF